MRSKCASSLEFMSPPLSCIKRVLIECFSFNWTNYWMLYASALIGSIIGCTIALCQISFLVTNVKLVFYVSLKVLTRIVLPGVGLNGFTRITPVIICLHFIEVPTDSNVVCYASVMVSRCGRMINLNCNPSHHIINVLSNCFTWSFDLKLE